MQPHVADLGVALTKLAAPEPWHLLFRHPACAAGAVVGCAHCRLSGVVSTDDATEFRRCVAPGRNPGGSPGLSVPRAQGGRTPRTMRPAPALADVDGCPGLPARIVTPRAPAVGRMAGGRAVTGGWPRGWAGRAFRGSAGGTPRPGRTPTRG